MKRLEAMAKLPGTVESSVPGESIILSTSIASASAYSPLQGWSYGTAGPASTGNFCIAMDKGGRWSTAGKKGAFKRCSSLRPMTKLSRTAYWIGDQVGVDVRFCRASLVADAVRLRLGRPRSRAPGEEGPRALRQSGRRSGQTDSPSGKAVGDRQVKVFLHNSIHRGCIPPQHPPASLRSDRGDEEDILLWQGRR